MNERLLPHIFEHLAQIGWDSFWAIDILNEISSGVKCRRKNLNSSRVFFHGSPLRQELFWDMIKPLCLIGGYVF
jgi:hypothetical protein